MKDTKLTSVKILNRLYDRFKLKTVNEVVKYYQQYNNLNSQKQKMQENNWE